MAIYLGIGSNLGDRLANVTAALTNFSILQQSSIYETEPVDFREQPWFFNAVINIETPLSPEKLLEFCQDIENRLGRKREVPKGPRVIDIDMLFYENFVLAGPLLIIPHPEI